MAWRRLELKDIAATLSQRELDDFRKHPDFESGSDPVADLLVRTAALVRGYIRKNAEVKMSPDEDAIPASLVSPACDYAAFDILKRLPSQIHEWRRAARDQAIALFKDVAENRVTPESHEADETSSQGVFPRFAERGAEVNNLAPWRV